MSVVLALEELGPCKKLLKIEIPAPAVEAESTRVIGEMSRKVRVPGFRKGKVPIGIVRRQFGEEIHRELIERLVPRYWRQAAAEKGIEPLGSPRVADVHYHDGQAMTFSAEVEVRPEFELRNYKDFSIPAIEVEPSAEEVQAAIDGLRRNQAEWVAVDRPAAVGDRAIVELTELTELVETPDGPKPGEPQSATFEVGSPRVWEELNLAASGLAPGQSTRFVRKEGDADQAKERAFDLRMVGIEEARLPELDDAFAAKVAKLDSAEALKTDVTSRLRAARRDEVDAERQRLLLDQLTERHPMPLPDGVVKNEVEELLREYAEGLVRRGVDLEHAEIDWQKMGEEARPHAERRVKARLLLDAIAEKESIDVSETEFEQAIALLARVQGVASGALRQRLDASGELAGLRGRMRREKVVRYLLGGEGAPAPESAG